MDFQQWFIVSVGLFSIAAAGFNWEWFFNNRRALFIAKILGNSRFNARLFYAALGIGLCILGYTI